MTTATAVTVFHPAEDAVDFGRWSQDLLESARAAPGHVSDQLSVCTSPQLDCAVAATFSGEDELHAWLDSAQRADVLTDGQQRGHWRSSVELILTDGGALPPGVGLFRHDVEAGRVDDFQAMQLRLSTAAVGLPGYQGTVLLPPDQQDEWISMVRFRTGAQLAGWMRSAERTEALSGLRSTLRSDFSTVSNTTPFATTVRIEDGRTLMTPNWKSAMLVLLVLYPTVMLLSRFVGPVLDGAGAQPWLGLWISQIASVAAMQWWLMPTMSRPFRRWLDPVDGAGWRTSFTGLAVIVVLYGVTLTVFATVRELQFWDYAD